MDCKNLGIGLIVLSATLFLGITISEILELKEIPEIEVAEEIIDSLNIESFQDCEPKDKDLKYQNLPYVIKENHYMEIDESKLPKLIPIPAAPKNGKQDTDNPKKDKTEDLKKVASEVNVPLPKQIISGNQTLVHKEICREKREWTNNQREN